MTTTVRPRTYDELALEILVSRAPKKVRDARLHRLYEVARYEGGKCPECGYAGPHEDNGATRASELAFCCGNCGTHWDAHRV
jgi:hypothetical protein